MSNAMWASFMRLARSRGFSQEMVNDAYEFARWNYQNRTTYRSERHRADAVQGFMRSRRWSPEAIAAVTKWDSALARGENPDTYGVGHPAAGQYAAQPQQQPARQQITPIQKWATATSSALSTREGYERYWQMARDPAHDTALRQGWQDAANASAGASAQGQATAGTAGGDGNG